MMPAPSCTDAEFIELWKEHKSCAKIARVLQMQERKVSKRRREIEHRHNVKLESPSPHARYYTQYQPYEHLRKYNLGIENGQVVVFSDAHFWPGIHTVAYKGLVKLVRDLKPKVVINGGDAFDGAQISNYPRIGWDSTPSVIQELKAVEVALGELEDEAKGAKLIWCLGNHDARFENRLAKVAPEFEGIHGFHLKDHFESWTPCWAMWLNEEVVVKHRYKNGVHATHNNTVNAGISVVTGHLHSLKVTPFSDYKGTRYGVDTGTLADPYGPQFSNYTELSPVNWRSGFAVLTFHKGRLLMPQLAQKWDEKHIEFGGQLIEV
jgi:hypothetical protein